MGGLRTRIEDVYCMCLRSMQTEVAVVVELGPWAVDRGPWTVGVGPFGRVLC